ncbi:hypothetical protein [Rhodohalobacter sp. 614A]|uniref:hypothetical protein n=1 Tax=Rhodohalobacter sp. 614A TaxID=2908649 RepID=UPI001F3B08BE|nr:hypothetical protein [Rhodohalobacter sp. 614A]
MEHTSAYGNTSLVDFISIFKSEGISSDWIQVNNNRARTNGTGSGMDTNGSFIMLGDWGGKYQEAKNNIGVNPGQVGIGAASGNHIRVEDNQMYSQLIDGISNVAFYSWKNPIDAPNCSNHIYENNIANWIYGKHDQPNNYGNQNIAWSNGSCGLSHQILLSNTDEDTTMGPEIWNTW